MRIEDLKKQHITKAKEIARLNYCEQQKSISDLPYSANIPQLDDFVENGLGVVAFEGDEMVGFLGCYNPWENAFDSKATGTFIPLHAHGAVRENRDVIYQKLYQRIAEKLVSKGVLYHGIAVYEHDKEAIQSFFHNGFGHRCADGIRKMEQIQNVKPVEGMKFEEIAANDAALIRGLRKELNDHMGSSCCFMYSSNEEFDEWVKNREQNGNRLFIAKENEKIIAFIEISDEGETFITEISSMKSIRGAYCLSEFRGKMVVQNLLNFVINILQTEGYKYLGVDYESFNPTAYHFWNKYFHPYTCSLTRRIDECVLNKF